MKKFIVMALMLLGLVSNASAGSAPAAYYWDILAIASSGAVTPTGVSMPNTWENVEGNVYTTTWDHSGTVYAVIGVLGYSNPVTTFNNGNMQLWNTEPIYDSTGTAIGWYYYYVSSGSSGNVEIKDWSGSTYGTRDTVYVK